ncbi:DUF418 domain-containing protein [Roseobacteraceae bacterium NS-SX3]
MRLHGLDIARFLAFCGMVLANFRIAAQVTPGTDAASLFTNALEDRAAALFVVLAGIGLSLARPSQATLFARALFLFTVGMINLTIFEADILHFYAVYFLAALPLLGAPRHMLLWAAAGAVAVSLLGFALLDYEAHWDWETLAYRDFWTAEGFLRNTFFNGWHPVFPWVAFLFLGMWIGRLNLQARPVQAALLAGGLAAALLGMVPARIVQDPELAEIIGTVSIPPGPFYVLSASGSAAAVTGLLLLITPALDKLGFATWFAAPGRQALTLYAAHILLGMGTLEAMGQLDGSLTPQEILGYSLGFCVLSMIYAWFWDLVAARGPLETLMRWTTKGVR